MIGTVNLDINQADGVAMLGFAIGSADWARESAPNLSGRQLHGASKLSLAKIWTTTDARNVRSQRLMEKLGMQLEGRLRSHEHARDGRNGQAP